MGFAADTDIWRYQPHPEVWLIIAVIIGFGYWVIHVLGPKAVPDGEPVVTRHQKIYFVAAVGLLWVSSDWPLHDISEEYLYGAHMIQHMLITLVVPPLFLLAVPEWLARLIVSTDGTSGVWVRRLTRPVVAAVLFNVLIVVTHLKPVVNFSIENGVFHYVVHLSVFSAALLMWMPVVSPLPELRASPPGQMIFLFLNSVLPTVPGAFLTVADNPLYRVYNHDVRLWGISAVADQQAAGLIMKLGGGFYIWAWIAFLFFRWANRDDSTLRPGDADIVHDPAFVINNGESDLTFEEVQTAFDHAGEPITESVKRNL
jgi:putative membrane protein